MENNSQTLANYKGEKFKVYQYRIENGLAYTLAIPEQFENGVEPILETYNLSNKMRSSYEENIEDSKKQSPLDRLIEVSDGPIICPVLPNFLGDDAPDYQQLARECFTNPQKGFERIDLQVIDCIKEAKRIVKKLTGKDISEKLFIHGYSASGEFAQRFTLIHPELISKCCVGGVAGDIPVPTVGLGYPIGISDFEELFGKSFDEKGHRSVEYAYYVSEKEAKEDGNYDINGNIIERDKFGNRTNKTQIPAPMHDMSYRLKTVPLEIGKKQRKMFGEDLDDRWRKSIEFLKEHGYDISGIICKNAEHRGIYSNEYNQYFPILAQKIIDFYKNGKRFEFDSESCAEHIDMSFQRQREEQARIGLEIDKQGNSETIEKQEEIQKE